MFEIFLLVFAIFLVCCFLLALGLIYRNKPLRGSCGGMSAVTGEKCSICGASSESECRKEETEKS